MGTGWSVLVQVAPGTEEGPIHALVEARLARIVQAMSTWEPGSDISRFNRAAAGSSHVLPEDFRRVLACALSVARATGGAFDPTIGPAAELWGFGPGGAQATRPDAPAITAARGRISHERLRLDGPSLTQPGGVALDLSGIAKGYAVDAVCAALVAAGHRDALVEIGGELRGIGLKPDGAPWWVELERPPGADALPRTVAALFELAVATSGDYRRRAAFDGEALSHTIDPRTGEPLQTGLASVSVFAPTCMEADAWATALTVFGPDEGLRLAAVRDIPALFVLREAGGWRERLSPSLAEMAE